MINILLVILYVFFTVSGLVLFKIGSDSFQLTIIAKKILNLQINFTSLIGLGCYLVSFFIYLVLVSKNTLSFIIPTVTGIVYVGILAASIFLLKEKMTQISLIGSILILSGIIMMGFNGK